jgi:hypothetical protein
LKKQHQRNTWAWTIKGWRNKKDKSEKKDIVVFHLSVRPKPLF